MNDETPKVFEVTAIEFFKADTETGDTKDPVTHIWVKDRIGTDVTSLLFEIRHELTTKLKLKGKEVAAFRKRLKVRVDLIENFQD